ncbi:MAG: hypothetical protein GYA70_05010, partial [Deltaproteobacteria bacterium]|nr:hypothetical protein [Deltaproteobacteria bacterium]
GLWIGSGGLLGWICHVIAAITAYNYAKRLSVNNPDSMPPGADFMKKEENFDILKDGKK